MWGECWGLCVTHKAALTIRGSAPAGCANAAGPNPPMLCTAATPKPPASRARRDKYRSYGVMSDGRIWVESVDLLRMVSLKYPKYASRPIDRSTGAIVSVAATLSPIRGGYTPPHPHGA